MTTPLSGAVINFHAAQCPAVIAPYTPHEISLASPPVAEVILCVLPNTYRTGCIAERGKNKATEMVALLHAIEIRVLCRVLFRFYAHAQFDGIIHHA